MHLLRGLRLPADGSQGAQMTWGLPGKYFQDTKDRSATGRITGCGHHGGPADWSSHEALTPIPLAPEASARRAFDVPIGVLMTASPVRTHRAALLARDLVTRYGDRVVLHGVDLVASPGSPLGLVGENGAG